jgi:hypothetical protein
MLNAVLAWIMVAVGGLAFGGFLFSVSVALTLLDRISRQNQSVPIRIHRRRSTPANRMWA